MPKLKLKCLWFSLPGTNYHFLHKMTVHYIWFTLVVLNDAEAVLRGTLCSVKMFGWV